VTDDELRARLNREGITDPTQQTLYLDSRRRVSAEVVVDQWQGGRIEFNDAVAALRRHGYTDAALSTLLNLDGTLGRGDAENWYFRSRGAQARELEGAYRADDLGSADRRELMLESSRPLPSTAQTLSWARRGAFDNDLAARWGLDAGQPAQHIEVSHWTGAHWHPRNLGAPAGQSTWPFLDVAEWRASHTLLTPGEAIQASLLLTPPRLQRYVGLLPNLHPFTPDDLAAIYRAYGYSSVHADWHRALAVPEIPARTYLQLYYLRQNSGPRVRRRLERQGYLPADIDDWFELIDARREYRDGGWARRKGDEARNEAYAAAERGYKLGSYTRAQAESVLLTLGIDGNAIAGILTGWEAAENQKEAATVLRTLKRGFMSGEFSIGEVQSGLLSLRIQPDRIALYSSTWTLERTYDRRVASSAQIVRWVGEGLLGTDIAAARLLNLGWTAPDVALQLAEATAKLGKLQATAAAAQAKSRGQAAKIQEALVHQHQRAAAAAQAALKRLTPLSQLKRWFKEGVLSQDFIGARLLAMGYPQWEIDALFQDWGAPPATTGKKGAAAAAAPATSPPPPPAPAPPGP
jgi:hypothetical protein